MLLSTLMISTVLPPTMTEISSLLAPLPVPEEGIFTPFGTALMPSWRTRSPLAWFSDTVLSSEIRASWLVALHAPPTIFFVCLPSNCEILVVRLL